MQNWMIRQEVDLGREDGQCYLWPKSLMLQGDNLAHTWEVSVSYDGMPVDFGGCVLMGYFDRSDDATVVIPGTIDQNILSVTFTQDCYVYPGILVGMLRVRYPDGTFVSITQRGFDIAKGPGDQLIDPGDVIPSLEDLLAKIEEIDRATAEAWAAVAATEQAVQDANAIIVRMDAAVAGIEDARNMAEQVIQDAQDAIDGVDLAVTDMQADVNTMLQGARGDVDAVILDARGAIDDVGVALESVSGWLDVDVDIDMLAPDAAASGEIVDREGGKTLMLEIPRGLTGAIGPVGPPGPQGPEGGVDAQGVTAGTAAALTLDAPGGFVLADGATVRFKTHLETASDACTLDVGGTGAVILRTKDGDQYLRTVPADTWVDATYSAGRAAWLVDFGNSQYLNGQPGYFYQRKVFTLTLTLTVAGWVNNRQVVTASGVTANCVIFPSFADGYEDLYAEAGIKALDPTTANSITFTCKETPTKPILATVAVFLTA